MAYDQKPPVKSPHTFPVVGRCIYCFATEVPLTDEHIIPEGLGGRIELPKASCKACNKITSYIERECLRQMVGPARYRMGFGKKSHKKRRADMTITLMVTAPDGSEELRTYPIADAPAAIGLFSFRDPPGVLSGQKPTDGLTGKPWATHNDADGRRYRISGWRMRTRFHAGLFARLLAKIAHANAVAVLGLDKFKPLLLDLIRIGGPTNLVGGTWIVLPKDIALHRTSMRDVRGSDGRIYLRADIRLFANLGGPLFSVVVGERNVAATSHNEAVRAGGA